MMMSKTYGETAWEAFIQFISAMSFPLKKVSIEACTSSDEAPSLQYGWPRHSKNRRESIRLFTHSSILYYIFTASEVMSRSRSAERMLIQTTNSRSSTSSCVRLQCHRMYCSFWTTFHCRDRTACTPFSWRTSLGACWTSLCRQTDPDASMCGFYAATSQSGSLRCIVRG